MSFVTCKSLPIFLNNINVNFKFILEIRQFFKFLNESELENFGKIALLR